MYFFTWEYNKVVKAVTSSTKGIQFLKLLLFNMISMTTGDYVNSKEYRQPEWITQMEEIQKRLSGKWTFHFNISSWHLNFSSL